MSAFIQFHVLTSHAPSNLNRDDTGRPKTALMGDALRLRISSQSQKRAWRTSDVFEEALGEHLGKRTRMLGKDAYNLIKGCGVDEKKAREWARQIAGCFGKIKSDKKAEQDEDLQIEQLAHVSPVEQAAVLALAKTCGERKAGPDEAELKLLTKEAGAVDIAMFGRMLADSPAFNVEAAVQVAHAITVHRAAVEDDYFSAVDDLNPRGAGHIGERGFGAGLFYLYVCVNRDLLKANLNGDDALTGKALEALLQAITKVSPTGMQNSFASRAYASYVLAEKGSQQPRSLSQAFIKPVKPFGNQSMLSEAIAALVRQRDSFDKVYGACADGRHEINAEAGTGSLQELSAFVQG